MQIPASRHFTTTANDIDLRIVMAAARQFRRQPPSKFSRIGVIRSTSGTIRECAARALQAAFDERYVYSTNPNAASADAVDAAISALAVHFLGTEERKNAIRAHHRGRPCILPLNRNGCAAIIADAFNKGSADMSEWLGEDGVGVTPAPHAWTNIHLESLRPVNAAGARAITAIAAACKSQREAA